MKYFPVFPVCVNRGRLLFVWEEDQNDQCGDAQYEDDDIPNNHSGVRILPNFTVNHNLKEYGKLVIDQMVDHTAPNGARQFIHQRHGNAGNKGIKKLCDILVHQRKEE